MNNGRLKVAEDSITLNEWLENRFFVKNEVTFQVFYDPNYILESFFVNEKNKYKEYRLLYVKSSSSPSEFIARKEIVANFNIDTGWYQNKWIVYITGEFCSDIETTESFYYYEEIGKVYRYATLLDLLLHPQIGLIDSKNQDSLLEKEHACNKVICDLLLELPLSCFLQENEKKSEKSFNENAVWMA